MSSGNKSSKAVIFETILSGPGMEDTVKISIPMSRKNILVLCRMIEQQLLSGGDTVSDQFFGAITESSKDEFVVLQKMILEKTALENFYERLKSLE